MRTYTAWPGRGLASLEQREGDKHPLAPGEVRVRIRAVALNYRDTMILEGSYGLPEAEMVPVSDGAGEVLEVGEGVEEWSAGDRVIGSCLPAWTLRRLVAPPAEEASIESSR